MVREYSERLLELRPDSTVVLEGLAARPCATGDNGEVLHAAGCRRHRALGSLVRFGAAHQKSRRWEQATEAYTERGRVGCSIETIFAGLRERF
jgi:hypothetical protein